MLFSEYVAAAKAVTNWDTPMFHPQYHRAVEKVYDMAELDAVIDAAERANRVWGKDGFNEGFAIRHGATIEFIATTPRGQQLFYKALAEVRKEDELTDALYQIRNLAATLEGHGLRLFVKPLDNNCGCQACDPCTCEVCKQVAERIVR